MFMPEFENAYNMLIYIYKINFPIIYQHY